MTTQLPIILPDTNFLLTYPAVHKHNWALRPVEIAISETVRGELIGQANRPGSPSAVQASRALTELNQLQAQVQQGNNAYQKGKIVVSFVPRPTSVPQPLDRNSPDHQLIALAQQQLLADPPRFCAILTNDEVLSQIAEALSVLVVTPRDRESFRGFDGELGRKYEWWARSQQTRETQSVQAIARPPQLNPEPYFDRVIRSVYHRVRAARHRAILSLAPLRARLGLTLRLIERVPKPEKRTVLLIVESRESAQYWAAVLRRQGSFEAGEVPVFGLDNLDSPENTRVLVYCHDQLGRRLPQHLARLTQAHQSLTAIVDGCDLLDPVDLAQLLFECDQFIGMCRYPLEYAQTPGHRMLNAFLRDRSILSYSFADAECDGWGHPFDLYLHSVSFTSEERREWERLNADYVRLREQAMRRHPELRKADNFWETLHSMLLKKALPEEAQLIPLREGRERMALLARNKLGAVKQLLCATPKRPYGRLILDYDGQWTPGLLDQLKTGTKVAELKHGNSQDDVWGRFLDGELDTLLLSQSPRLDLPCGPIHQLVILTPLRPMPEISDVVDWTLTHTKSQDSLRVDLLYVSGTPEELAMFELAESSFDLRYERGQ